MAAKKDVIKALRQEIAQLDIDLKNQVKLTLQRERQIGRMNKLYVSEISRINTHTNVIANKLKYKFAKQLSWHTLCQDPESATVHLVDVIEDLIDLEKYSLSELTEFTEFTK